MKKQVFNHMAPLENGADTSSVTYYVRDANEAVMAIYQQKVIHTSGMFGCLRKPSNNVGGDSDLDGVVDGGCDNCRPSMLGTLPGAEWNPWQEDYDRDGVGDACDPCPFHFSPPNAPCVGPLLFPEPEVWTGIAVTTTLAELPIYGSERIGLLRPNALRDTSFYLGAIFTRQVGKKEYELKDHLGNVRVVVSDLKGKEGTAMFARVKSVNSYYAFGMLEEGMSGSSGGYRYGFNGKESDNEISGEGNQYDYGFRIYNPRLGKFLSVDPLTSSYPMLTPYQFAGNMPIHKIDRDGLEPATPEEQQKAMDMVNEFSARSETDKTNQWTGFNKTDFITDIRTLITAPHLLNQGGTNLCGVAAMCKVAMQYKPELFTEMAISIYESGFWTAGGTNVIYANENTFAESAGPISHMGLTSPNNEKLSPVALVVMSSIRNSYNSTYNYSEPYSESGVSGLTRPADVSKFLTNFMKMSIDSYYGSMFMSRKSMLNTMNSTKNSGGTNIVLMDTKKITGITDFISQSWHYVEMPGVKYTPTTISIDNLWDYGGYRFNEFNINNFFHGVMQVWSVNR